MNMASSLYFDPTLEQMITQHNFEERFSDQLRRLARNDPLLTRLNLFVKEIGDTGTASELYSHYIGFGLQSHVYELTFADWGIRGSN